MSIFGAIVGGIVGGPIGVILGDKFSGGETVVGTGPGMPAVPPPFTGEGTSGDDIVRIRRSTTAILADLLYDVEINGQHYIVSQQELESTVFRLGGGDDQLLVDPDVKASITARGGDGDDTMIGGTGNDRFDGGSGDDVLIGRDGNDSLRGGSGDDDLLGDRGCDVLDGGSGSNNVLRDVADFTAPIAMRNPKLFVDYADIVSAPSNRDAELSRG
jgi:Ca2+-binding RTX toxin-like protein